ncbi:MAG: glycosyltransferase [Mojavia pulchra JT2-VF2]|jgi:MGT family glycosyltransferase|uniref:Glycosyltransferase n=1 Tax=Mojavia pulchra JT2-VF2 TaxID=287848 RepID=A0A951Q0X8_9NOST|nr:glycosyltransferase [Mojavia pulchra JT2-VF2]
MTHFGILSPGAATGPLNTMLPLGQELQRRGHRVTLFGTPDTQPKALAAGIEFQSIGEKDFPVGATAESFVKLGELRGLAALQYTIDLLKQVSAITLQDAPAAIKAAGVEALLVNQSSVEGGTIADFLEIPFVTVCSAVVLNREPSIPPFFTTWKYSPARWARLRNELGYTLVSRIAKPLGDLIDEYRRQWKLPLYSALNDGYSQLAQISNAPAEFEYPRQELPPWFHFTGSYHTSANRVAVPFPYEKLTGKPLIYASMGTLQNRLTWVFETIASACEGLDAQLVISLGGSAKPESLPNLPGNPLVVEYAPQLEVLEKATLMIIHAGMNTTMECVKKGVPMVAIPVANDQPGVAARIAWTGAGEFVTLKKLTVPRLRNAVRQVLTEKSYKQNALRLQEATHRAGGVSRAADIIEQAVSTGKPVISGQA